MPSSGLANGIVWRRKRDGTQAGGRIPKHANGPVLGVAPDTGLSAGCRACVSVWAWMVLVGESAGTISVLNTLL
jgi:hypothetical protein